MDEQSTTLRGEDIFQDHPGSTLQNETQTQVVLPQSPRTPLWVSVKLVVQQVAVICSLPEAPRVMLAWMGDSPSYLTPSFPKEGRIYWKLHIQDFNPALTFLSYLLETWLPSFSEGGSNMQQNPHCSHVESLNKCWLWEGTVQKYWLAVPCVDSQQTHAHTQRKQLTTQHQPRDGLSMFIRWPTAGRTQTPVEPERPQCSHLVWYGTWHPSDINQCSY